MPVVGEPSHVFQPTPSLSVPTTEKDKGPSSVPSSQESLVPNTSIHPSYEELLKQNKVYKVREQSMNLELSGYKTRVLAWKTEVRELKFIKLKL